MTLVYNVPDPAPRMHALVVGCGRFPFMDDPNAAARQACYDSAVEMVRFLVAHESNFIPPLASIHVLLSDPRVDPATAKDALMLQVPGSALQPGPVDSAVQANVTAALGDFVERCRPGDSLFLYFCSHGVAGRDETGLLVLEDANKNRANPWRQMLDVKYLAQALPACSKAASVWVFLDACQEVIPDLKDRLGGMQLDQPVVATATEMARCSVVSATLSAGRYGAEVHAPPGGGTAYFTSALIEGMTTCCVERRERQWRVTAMRIMYGVEKVARAVDGAIVETSQLIPFNKEAHLLRIERPGVPVHIESIPGRFLEGATLAQLFDDGGNVVSEKIVGQEWRFRVSHIPASYSLRVTYEGHGYDTELEIDAPALSYEMSQPNGAV